MSKLLSICIAARNDNYGGNFQYIFTTSLNHLGKSVRLAGAVDEVEVLITDWNSEVALSETMALTPDARAICRFLRVPPAVAKKYTPPGKVFNSGIAGNVAVRRCTSDYIMATNADALFSATGIGALVRLLKGQAAVPFATDGAFMLIRRKMIPWEFVAARPSVEALDRYIIESGWMIESGMYWPGLCGNNAAMVAHRRVWHSCRAGDEGLTGWGWNDIDVGLRMNQRYPSYCLTELGVTCYELDVAPTSRQGAMTGSGANARVVNLAFAPNGEGWGLEGETLAVELPSGPDPTPIPSPPRPTKEAVLQGLCEDVTASTIYGRLAVEFTKQPDFAAGYLLGYCALQFRPSTFLDFGFMRGGASLYVPALHRTVNVIGVNPWQTQGIVAYANEGAEVVKQLNYAGNLHFLSGDFATSIDRLGAGLPPEASIDLVYLMLDGLPPSLLEALPQLAPRLSKRPVFVLFGGTPELFARVLATVRKLVEQPMTVMSEVDRTAMVLSGEDDARQDRHEDLEATIFEVLRQRRLS